MKNLLGLLENSISKFRSSSEDNLSSVKFTQKLKKVLIAYEIIFERPLFDDMGKMTKAVKCLIRPMDSAGLM